MGIVGFMMWSHGGDMDKDFNLVPGNTSIWLERNRGSQPPHAVSVARQNDCGSVYLGVADTQWGRIPGKAHGGQCHYPYDDREHSTTDFFWVCATSEVKLERRGIRMPASALKAGFQNDGAGEMYHVVANTH